MGWWVDEPWDDKKHIEEMNLKVKTMDEKLMVDTVWEDEEWHEQTLKIIRNSYTSNSSSWQNLKEPGAKEIALEYWVWTLWYF